MRVELDLFSGQRNPSWELAPEQSAELVRRLAGLPQAKRGAIRDGLGYRGIVVTTPCAEVAAFATLIVSGGRVLARTSAGAERPFLDRSRALERWLLETARGRLDPEIRTLIEQDLDEGHDSSR